MAYVIHYKNGKIVKEGRGLSFFYYAPSSSIAAIPMGSSDIPFIFTESTADFQTITIQGQITFKIENPKQLAEMLDFTVNTDGEHLHADEEKMSQRLVNEAQTATSAFIQSISLKDALRKAKDIETRIMEGLKSSEAVNLLGVSPLSVNVIAVKASANMERALEAATREALQQEADQAVYARRNFAVEQERIIKESELNTEIAVEEKQKLITEKKMEAKLLVQNNKRQLREMQIEADIAIEEQRKLLIDSSVVNKKKEADAQAYVLKAVLEPYKDINWKTLMAISKDGLSPKQNIALAFRELSENAGQISNLNITPDLLQNLL